MLYLIRHPKPQVVEGVCYGRSDLPLADAVAPLLPGILAQLPSVFSLHSSPLRRCRELAQAIAAARALPLQLADDLQELDFGGWEGQRWQAIGAPALDAWIASGYGGQAHGGEAYADLCQRVRRWADAVTATRAAAEAAPVVAVCHAGPIRVLLGASRGWSFHRCFAEPLPFAGVTRLPWPPSLDAAEEGA